MKAIKVMLVASMLTLLPACTNTVKVLEGADYVCVQGDIVGRWTGSQFDGKGIKVPEGVEATPELIETICKN